MNITEIQELHNSIYTKSEALWARRDELLAPIQKELDEIALELRSDGDVRVQRAGEIFSQATLEDLYDSEKMRVYSDIAWNRGLGAKDTSIHLSNLLEGTYLRSRDFYSNPEIISFVLQVPLEKDEEILRKTAEIAEKIYAAQEILNPDGVRLDVFEDSLSEFGSYYVKKDENEWICAVRFCAHYSSDNLFDLLKKIPTYC